MRPTCVVHVVWHHFIPEPFTPFSWVPWSVLWLHHQFVTDVTAWLITPNPSCSKNRKRKNKVREKIKCSLPLSYASPPIRKTTSPQWCHLWTLQVRLPRQPPYSQHILWRYCNPPDILSSTAEVLLFNSVFHDGVAPVSVSTLKPLLRAIGVLPLKPWASPILSVCI